MHFMILQKHLSSAVTPGLPLNDPTAVYHQIYTIWPLLHAVRFLSCNAF